MVLLHLPILHTYVHTYEMYIPYHKCINRIQQSLLYEPFTNSFHALHVHVRTYTLNEYYTATKLIHYTLILRSLVFVTIIIYVHQPTAFGFLNPRAAMIATIK